MKVFIFNWLNKLKEEKKSIYFLNILVDIVIFFIIMMLIILGFGMFFYIFIFKIDINFRIKKLL